MHHDEAVVDALVKEVRRRLFGESMPRIERCLAQLNEEQTWWKPNEESNSVGNLLLHLEGNVRQWILTGIAEEQDTRTRDSEFEATGGVDKGTLWRKLEMTMQEVDAALDLVTPANILHVRDVQVFEEPVLSILVHVTEHFSYHTGQIAWITKMLTGEQLHFYGDLDLG